MFEGPRPTVNPVNTQFSLMIAQFLAKSFNPFEFLAIFYLKNLFAKEIRNAKENSNIFFRETEKALTVLISDPGPKLSSIGQKWTDFDVLKVKSH